MKTFNSAIILVVMYKDGLFQPWCSMNIDKQYDITHAQPFIYQQCRIEGMLFIWCLRQCYMIAVYIFSYATMLPVATK